MQKNNLGVIYKKGGEIKPNIATSIEYFKEAIHQKSDKIAMFNLAHIYFYEEYGVSDLNKSIELLIKSSKQYFTISIYLLCLALIKKYTHIDISQIQRDFKSIDNILALSINNHVKEINLENHSVYQEWFDEMKDYNLVYYGSNIKNQKLKTKIDIVDKKNQLDDNFYEGFEFI